MRPESVMHHSAIGRLRLHRPGNSQLQRIFAESRGTQESEILVAASNELDADGEAIVGKTAANHGGWLSRLVEDGGIGRDVHQPLFVGRGLLGRKTDDR